MITERDIAEKFSIIWKQNFPLLTPNFMRVFNEAQIDMINLKSIPTNDEIRYDLVSELAFNLAAELIETDITPGQFFIDYTSVIQLVSKTARNIWKSGNYSQEDLKLNESEECESILICSNIIEFVNKIKKENHVFMPKLKGYGVIPDLIADISIDDTLYEIKTVNRNFRSSDLKQLLIYLALQQVTGEMKWRNGGLYNPRRGVYCKFNIKSLIYNISGGKSSNEVFENLLDSLKREIQIDSKF